MTEPTHLLHCERGDVCSREHCPHKHTHVRRSVCHLECPHHPHESKCEPLYVHMNRRKDTKDARSMDFHEGWVKGFYEGRRFNKWRD